MMDISALLHAASSSPCTGYGAYMLRCTSASFRNSSARDYQSASAAGSCIQKSIMWSSLGFKGSHACMTDSLSVPVRYMMRHLQLTEWIESQTCMRECPRLRTRPAGWYICHCAEPALMEAAESAACMLDVLWLRVANFTDH